MGSALQRDEIRMLFLMKSRSWGLIASAYVKCFQSRGNRPWPIAPRLKTLDTPIVGGLDLGESKIKFQSVPISQLWIRIGAVVSFLLVICATMLPMRMGLRAFRRLEF
jgi:hypothetical protein